MKTLILIALAITPVAALADSFKLKVADLIQATESLGVVADGATEQVVDLGRDGKRVARIAFEYTGKVRFLMVRNLAAMRLELEKVEQTRVAIVNGGGKDVDRQWAEVQQQVVTIDLTPLTEADLNLDKNQIPGTRLSILAALGIISDGTTRPKKQ